MTPPEQEPDYYSDLGVTPLESQDEIRKAYEILIAGVNLLSKSFNPSVAAHSEEERRTYERAWAVLGNEEERTKYDLRRGTTKTYYGRYSLGYELSTGTARRPSAPKSRKSDPADVLSEMGGGRVGESNVAGRSGGGAEFGFDGFLGFGKPVGEGNMEAEKRKRRFSEAAADKKENKPF